jgi:hypothetical protein
MVSVLHFIIYIYIASINVYICVYLCIFVLCVFIFMFVCVVDVDASSLMTRFISSSQWNDIGLMKCK